MYPIVQYLSDFAYRCILSQVQKKSLDHFYRYDVFFDDLISIGHLSGFGGDPTAPKDLVPCGFSVSGNEIVLKTIILVHEMAQMIAPRILQFQLDMA